MSIRRSASALSLVLGSAVVARPASSLELPSLQLPYEETKLANGLTLVVHEDHALPQVATNLIYRVGSKDEQPGRTGFAHLFEHLMFLGTKRAPAKAFDDWMESAGGTNNAWTSSDFTDYHESGPSSLLPLFLWLEADRLETLGREIDKAKLDLQRDVVRNERRQTVENRPYGKVELRLPELMYPPSHPYHHPVIGSHADLEAASVEDVRTFFGQHYSPGNAALVVAGDVKASEVKSLVERSFGYIKPAPQAVASPPPSPLPPVKLDKVVRETIEDQVEMTKIVVAFPSPAHFQPGDAELDLFASILSSGKTSRLYKALVYEKSLAQSVNAAQDSSVLSSAFTLEIMVRPGVSADVVEKATDAILTEALAKPPTDEELQRAKNQIAFDFVDRLQSLAARARLLNMYWGEKGTPGYVAQDMARYERATPASVLARAKETINLNGRVILQVVPLAAKQAQKSDGKRSEKAQ
ncbi:MAG TPA: pitrilysin family protein [Polyangiaceae bacterium]|nr:pitrilysin family protein [Polyangiaceae bacterium]